MQKLTRIYALIDPRSNKVFYVGRTTCSLRRRLTEHIADARNGITKKGARIAILLKLDLEPEIMLLAELSQCSVAEIQETEQAWINFYRMTHELDNTSSGRSGGPCKANQINWTPELLAQLGKLSDADIARALGCTRTAMRYHRNKLGIPAAARYNRTPPPIQGKWHPDRKQWNQVELPKEIIEQLGLVTDTELGRLAGVSRGAVRNKRIKLGIPAFPQKERPWRRVEFSAEALELLGKVSDQKIANLMNVTERVIWNKRQELGIPSCYPARSPSDSI